jgi:ribosome maturation factor RimP
MQQLRETLLALLEPGVEALGYELLDIEYRNEGPRNILRLYIDQPTGVTVDDCGDVSRHVSGLLDVDDPIAEAYDLEVSSPGEKRPLRKPEHFAQFAGERAKVELLRGIDGRRRFTGVLEEVVDDIVRMTVDQTPVDLPFSDIARAHLAPLAN